mgnify:FL=1
MSLVGDIVLASDYNSIVGYNPTTALNTFNAVWGTGAGKFGYGQTPLATIDDPAFTLTDDQIKGQLWIDLVNAVALSSDHQATSITKVQGTSSMPAVGTTIKADTYNKTASAIVDLYTKHLNAANQGTSQYYPAVNGSIWRDAIEFTHTITFADGEKARYFFNCGGQLKLTFSSAPGIQINALMAKLGEIAGTLVISSPNVETIKIAGKNYNGVTKVGGSDPVKVDSRFTTERYGVQTFNDIASTVGYYGMSQSFQEIFKQSVGGFPSSSVRYNYYDGSYIKVNVKTNGPQGVNGDNGNVITIKTVWEQVPNGLQVTAGTTTTLAVCPPLLRTGMTKSWDDPVVSSTVSGT